MEFGTPTLFDIMLSRRSVMPKRLGLPAPSDVELQQIIDGAVTAPDHGGLCPWHFILIPDNKRADLAQIFISAKEKRHGKLTDQDRQREHEKAHNAPTLIAVQARLTHDNVTVSIQEQLVSIGAAIQNILLLAHQKGYGAIILSGERSSDPNVAEALGIPTTDKLIGFISIGTIKKPPREKTHPNGSDHLHSWTGLVK